VTAYQQTSQGSFFKTTRTTLATAKIIRASARPPSAVVLRRTGRLLRNSATGTSIALLARVTIAIPVSQARISPVLDAAVRLLLVTRRRGKEVERKEFVLSALPPEGLARSVAELRVDVLLCAALSEPLLRALERRGVRVKPHLCGEVESVLRAFCRRRLAREEFRMPGCWGQHLHGGCCRQRKTARTKNAADEETRQERLS
jgi:predicted Fe-Mo cluster-binding NifX family protein